MMKVLIADRVGINRVGFRSMLDGKPKRMSIDEAATEIELLSCLRRIDYDLVVVEPAIALDSGEDLLRKIRRVAPRAHILVLTSLTDLNFGFKAIRCGALGYLTKSCTYDELLAATSAVGKGNVYITADLAKLIAERKTDPSSFLSHDSLSDREFLVFSMLVAGNKVSQIASVLQLSIKTVSTHKCRIFEKLNIGTICELVTYAISQGLIEECSLRSKAATAKSLKRLNVDSRHKGALPEPAVGKHTGTIINKVIPNNRRTRF